MTHEWMAALRLQIEVLARRNDLHGRCTRDSVQKRTKEMEQKIIKMRELISSSSHANEAAQFYLECVCHADETERILNRTWSGEKIKKDGPSARVRYIPSFTTADVATSVKSIASSSAVEVISPEALPQTVLQRKWWNIHRKENYYEERKYEVRQLWKSQNNFLSHSMTLVIGVGNIIKFPALIYRFGGIVLIPYFLLHMLVGFPLVYLLLCIGQFAAVGPKKAMERMGSAATGLGWTLTLMAIPFCLYLNVYAAWSLFYLTDIVLSSSLPWSSCENNLTSTHSCCPIESIDACETSNSTLLSTEAFLHSNILHISGGLIGTLQPSLVAGLAAAWLLTALVYLKPTPTTQFSASFPVFMLIILCLCGASLPGASIGLSYLFSFNFKKLYSIELWLCSLEQVLFELALCGGPLIPLAALNRFRNNIYRDSAILVTSTTLCSYLAALVVFSFAGNLVHLSGIGIHRLAVFEPRYFTLVILPSMTETVQAGHLWFALFALAMTASVVDAQYSWVRLITSSLLAQFDSKNQRLETRLFLLFSVFGFVLGLPLCTKGGVYLFHSIDSLISTWTVTFCLLLLLILVAHVYGVNNFLRDITYMLRVPLFQRWSTLTPTQRISYVLGPGGLLVKYCWSSITPVTLILATPLFLATRKKIRIGMNPVPWPYETIAWILVASPVLAIPILFGLELHKAWKTGKTFKSILDGSKWSQLDSSQLESDTEQDDEPTNSKRRRAAMRENTYMYIDPLSRGNTERSVTALQVEDNYGWRVGRLKDFQEDRNLGRSDSPNSFEVSMTSQGTTKEITLFGSPPASNAFLMTEAIRERAAANRRQRVFSTTESVPTTNTTHLSPEGYNRSTSISEPPQIPNTPPPRSSPAAKSEPPRAMTDRPSSSIRSRSQGDSESEDEDGINPQRITVIRRFYSTDSVGPQSNTSISITPCDRMTDGDRQRSMSSLAIYDPQSESRPRQTLSQLKRPQPINAPNKSPSRF